MQQNILSHEKREGEYLDRRLALPFQLERMIRDKKSVGQYVVKYTARIRQLREELP